MAQLQWRCALAEGVSGLARQAAAAYLSHRLLLRFRSATGLSYGPRAWLDGGGHLRMSVELPPSSAPAALQDVDRLLSQPVQAEAFAQARLRLLPRVAPELYGPASLSYILMTAESGVLAVEEVGSMSAGLAALGPADLDGVLAGCAESAITTVLAPPGSLELEGFAASVADGVPDPAAP